MKMNTGIATSNEMVYAIMEAAMDQAENSLPESISSLRDAGLEVRSLCDKSRRSIIEIKMDPHKIDEDGNEMLNDDGSTRIFTTKNSANDLLYGVAESMEDEYLVDWPLCYWISFWKQDQPSNLASLP